MSRKIVIYDTTLRDGTQREGISLSCDDKLRIARRLDDFGVDYIEGGWPGSNPKDVEFFMRTGELNLKNAKIAAFGSTCRRRSSPAMMTISRQWLVQGRRFARLSENPGICTLLTY